MCSGVLTTEQNGVISETPGTRTDFFAISDCQQLHLPFKPVSRDVSYTHEGSVLRVGLVCTSEEWN